MEAIKEFYENNKNISLKIKDIYGDFNLIGYNLLNNTLIGLLKVPKNRIYYKYSNFNKLEEKYKLFNLLHFYSIKKVFLNLNLGSINFSADELGLPIEDERVLGVWSEKMRPMTDEVFDKVFKPLYFSKGK